jgi:hypothetical protein
MKITTVVRLWPTPAINDANIYTFGMAALWAEPAAGYSCPVRIYGTLFLVRIDIDRRNHDGAQQ